MLPALESNGPPAVVGGIWSGSKEKPNFEEDMVGIQGSVCFFDETLRVLTILFKRLIGVKNAKIYFCDWWSGFEFRKRTCCLVNRMFVGGARSKRVAYQT